MTEVGQIRADALRPQHHWLLKQVILGEAAAQAQAAAQVRTEVTWADHLRVACGAAVGAINFRPRMSFAGLGQWISLRKNVAHHDGIGLRQIAQLHLRSQHKARP